MQLLLNNIDKIIEAPNGIKKLRQMVLQLAFQGRLSEQNPNDEPARELLNRIKIEKEKLIAERKIKNQSKLPLLKDEDKPFRLPKSWMWSTFGEISQHNSGKTLDSKRNKGKARECITTSNLYWGYFEIDTLKKILIEDAELERCTVKKGDLLVCEGGDAGRAAIWNYESEVCFQNHIHRVRPYGNFSTTFLFLYFFYLHLSGIINKYRKGMGISNLSGKSLSLIVLPVPPLAEQLRIANKVNQLLKLLDDLKNKKEVRDHKKIILNNSSIDKLLHSKSGVEQKRTWNRINSNFDILYSQKENLKKLKQVILQFAVQGKLVEQDPNNEPASELLKIIKIVKAKIIADGKIKNRTNLLPIKEQEKPFVLPNGWEWVNLEDIGIVNPRNYLDDNKEVSFVPMANISDSFGENVISEKRKWGEIKSGFTHFAENDVVLAKITPCFENGKSAIMKNLINKFGAGTTELHIFRSVIKEVLPEFIYIYLRSPSFKEKGKAIMTGSAGQKRIPRDYFALNIFGLPPYNEQILIVKKVNELMNLCNKLEQNLTLQKAEEERLVNAMVSKV